MTHSTASRLQWPQRSSWRRSHTASRRSKAATAAAPSTIGCAATPFPSSRRLGLSSSSRHRSNSGATPARAASRRRVLASSRSRRPSALRCLLIHRNAACSHRRCISRQSARRSMSTEKPRKASTRRWMGESDVHSGEVAPGGAESRSRERLEDACASLTQKSGWLGVLAWFLMVLTLSWRARMSGSSDWHAITGVWR